MMALSLGVFWVERKILSGKEREGDNEGRGRGIWYWVNELGVCEVDLMRGASMRFAREERARKVGEI